MPLASGLVGILLGPVFGPDQPPVSPSVDSEYRFVSAIWATAGLLLWWSLRCPGARARATRTVLVAIIVGGVARLTSFLAVGPPMPLFVVALVVELLGVPLLLWWHVRAFPSRPDSVARAG